MRNKKENTFTEIWNSEKQLNLVCDSHEKERVHLKGAIHPKTTAKKEGSSNLIAGFWGPWEPNLIWKCNYTLHKLKVKMNKSRGRVGWAAQDSFLAVVIVVVVVFLTWLSISMVANR